MKHGIAGFVFTIVVILMLGGCARGQTVDMYKLPGYIMHAGGVTPDGLAGTNSIEALNNSYENGNYWIELDFNQTSDGVWVCLHDWYAYYSEKLTGALVPDRQTFEKYRTATYGYESPTLDTLAGWMKEHPLAVIVTDVKDNNPGFVKHISESYPDLADRFVIQIYSRDEYAFVEECGFERIIYTLYKEVPERRYDTELLRDFVQSREKLIALTYAIDPENADAIASVAELGIPLYVHTVNDPQEQALWFETGAYGFYSDYKEDADDK